MALRFDSEAVQVYLRLLGYVKPHAKILVVVVAAMIFYAAADAAFPLLMREIVGSLEEQGRDGSLLLPLAILAVFGLRAVFGFASSYGLGWVGWRAIKRLRAEMFDHYLGLPTRIYDESSTGILLSKLTYNTEQVAESITNVIVTLFRDSFTIVGLFGVMLFISVRLTALILLVTPVIALVIRMLSYIFRRYSGRIQNSIGAVTQVTEEVIAGHRIVKVFDGREYEANHFQAVNHTNARLHMRLVVARSIGDAITQLLSAVGIASVVFVAFQQTMLADLKVEDFVGFLTAMALLMAPLKRVTNINVALQRGIAAGESIFALLDQPLERDEGSVTIDRAKGYVEFRNVSFNYAEEKGQVLRNVDLTIPAGKTAAIVGRSGSGKSTLVSLLPRFYDIEAGEIRLDSRDIQSYVLADLRRQISLVSQDVVLFNDTIANNIAYGGLSDTPREAIVVAAEQAYVMNFAEQLPDGLDTVVGERGVLLSGGQRQRIAIARALLKDAPVLVLDEATSALDSESERIIQQALDQLMQNRTTLVIAHRLSTVERADEIIVLENGAIVETGTHQALLASGGQYATLYRMQFAD
jgi:subfamily B ATP-binding cassette protein MsbA